MQKSIASSCSEEDISGNRKIDDQNELSKADFLGWIAAKCKLLRNNSKTVFVFKALETFSELVAAILVKAYENESAVKCEETLYRSVIDEMLTKLGDQQSDRRSVQDIFIIWPIMKEFIEEIVSWKERQQQLKKDFFIRRAFHETKNMIPPVVITLASPQLIEDGGPKALAAIRKRRSAERQQSLNSSLIFVGSTGGCSSTMSNHVTLRKDENKGEYDEPKKRRMEEEAEKRKDKAIKQEVIEVVDDQQQNDETDTVGKEGKVWTKDTHFQQSSAPNVITLDTPDKETEKTAQQKEREEEEDDDDDDGEIYSMSYGDKSMFEPEEETPPTEPEEQQQLLKEVKREPKQNGESDEQQEKRGKDEEMTAGEEEDEEEEEQTEDDEEEEGEEGELTESEGRTDTPPPLLNKNVLRPYSTIKSTAANEPSNRSSPSIGDGMKQCKREHWAENHIEPQLLTYTAAADGPSHNQCSSSLFVDDFLNTHRVVSPLKRSEFDIFDLPISSPPTKSASPAKNEKRKCTGKIKIRKRKEYEAEQKLKRKLAIGKKVLRFSGDTSVRIFIINDENVMTRVTANEKNPFFVAPLTKKFLKKSSKSKNGGQKRRRHLDSQALQMSTDVHDVVTAVKGRSKELIKQLNSSIDGEEDELAMARGDRLVRFSRLLLTDSLLQRFDEDVLKNAYVLRSLEHPRDIGLFIEKGLNTNTTFLLNPSNLVYFEFSYLFVFYGHDQIVNGQRVPEPSEFLTSLRNWFLKTFPNDDERIELRKSYEEVYHYFYTPPRIVAVTIPEVGEYAEQFHLFNDRLTSFVSADSKKDPIVCFLLLDWAAEVAANCSADGNALDLEEKRMQMLAMKLNREFGVLIK